MHNGIKYYFANDDDGQDAAVANKNSVTFYYPCYKFNICRPYHVNLTRGVYNIELWGAQGGDGRELNTAPTILPNKGGRGSYVKGTLTVFTTMKLYLYIGGMGENQTALEERIKSYGGWNFGGDGGIDLHDRPSPESGAGGGGSVDIRLKYADLQLDNDSVINESILSRIIVAGSGGGAISDNTSFTNSTLPQYSAGGPAGSIEAYYTFENMSGGSQIIGELGRGGIGYSNGIRPGSATGGGGSGYRGGFQTIPVPPPFTINRGGPGGSSYISGHDECISPFGGKIHHSKIFFTDTLMIPGNMTMPQPNGEYLQGHSGHGCARITLIDHLDTIDEVYTNNLLSITFAIFIYIDYSDL